MLVDLLKKEKEELSRLDISKYIGKNEPYYLIYYKPSVSDFLSIQNFYADHKKESDFLLCNLFVIARIARLEDGSPICEASEKGVKTLLDNLDNFELIADMNKVLVPLMGNFSVDFTEEKKS